MTYDSIDLFAGAGGWSVAADNLGLTDLGIEVWGPAVATRDAAGLHSEQVDIRLVNPLDDRYLAPGLIASPPCQSFSAAGKGEGRAYIDDICSRIERFDWYSAHTLPEGAQLVLEPLRWIVHRYAVEQPFRWIALEQVPTCLPLWEAYASALGKLGYNTSVGVLDAHHFGAPQSRKRAVLMARLEGTVSAPARSETRIGFAEALGLDGDWTMVSNYNDGAYKGPESGRYRGVRHSPDPAFTLTGRCTRMYLLPGHHAPQRSTKGLGGAALTHAQAGVLQGFPADYPWQGHAAEKTLQIGNAVPVQLAEAVLRAVAL